MHDTRVIQVQKISPMSSRGIHQWGRNMRYKIDTNIRPFSRSVVANVDEIDTREKLANFIYNHFGSGHLNVLFRSHKKNRFKSSPVKRAELVIHEIPNGINFTYHVDKLNMMRFMVDD